MCLSAFHKFAGSSVENLKLGILYLYHHLGSSIKCFKNECCVAIKQRNQNYESLIHQIKKNIFLNSQFSVQKKS